jgi:hypothetical protein
MLMELFSTDSVLGMAEMPELPIHATIAKSSKDEHDTGSYF